jgi:predicted GTPase
MIVLDEQLLGRNLEGKIAQWYRGAVCFVTDLRPGTIIKDDSIPGLLRQENQPTFVTINAQDFWRKVAINNQFCLVCFTLPDSRASEIPALLRAVLRHPLFRSKRKRMGKVIRVTDQETSYYSCDDREVRTADQTL